MREAMQHAGLCIDDIPTLARSRALPGFRRSAHRTRPVLEMGLPLGVVTSINGSVRYRRRRHGQPCRHHPHGPPARRGRRHGRAGPCERRGDGDSVGTMGMLDAQLDQRGARRMPLQPGPARARQRPARRAGDRAGRAGRHLPAPGLRCELEETLRAAARARRPGRRAGNARSRRWACPHRMPSGAGHDAMKLHEAMPQAMLFVRGQNFGISHNPLESTTAISAAGPCATCSMRWRMR